MKANKFLVRSIFDLVLFILALTVPWWASLPFALFGALFFDDFFEVIFASVAIDSVQFDGSVGSIPFLFTIISVLIFLGASKFRGSFLRTHFI